MTKSRLKCYEHVVVRTDSEQPRKSAEYVWLVVIVFDNIAWCRLILSELDREFARFNHIKFRMVPVESDTAKIEVFINRNDGIQFARINYFAIGYYRALKCCS